MLTGRRIDSLIGSQVKKSMLEYFIQCVIIKKGILRLSIHCKVIKLNTASIRFYYMIRLHQVYMQTLIKQTWLWPPIYVETWRHCKGREFLVIKVTFHISAIQRLVHLTTHSRNLFDLRCKQRTIKQHKQYVSFTQYVNYPK